MLSIVLLWGCGSPEPATIGGQGPAEVMDPGPKMVHRLNRTEYDNTVGDLLHTPLRPGELLFPEDSVSDFGFDNQADLLTISPILAGLYEQAADLLVDDLFRVRDETRLRREAQVDGANVVPLSGELTNRGLELRREGEVLAVFPVEGDGYYNIGVVAFGTRDASTAPVRMAIEVNEQVVGVFDVLDNEASESTVEVWLPVGEANVTARFSNPVVDDESPERRMLTVRQLSLDGPLDPEVGNRHGYDQVVQCQPDDIGETACATQTLTRFATDAWRRPLTVDEAALLDELYVEARAAGLGWRDAVGHGMKFVLMSPDFLFRVEADPTDGDVRALSGHEIASRLSYFLWNSTPDEALMTAADRGELADPAALTWHVDRMMADERASSMVDRFVSQWFSTDYLADLEIDPLIYPEFDEVLKASMAEEMRRLTHDFVASDLSMLDLLTTQETWIDERLAQHYGLPFPDTGADWVRADLTGTDRRGLLTTAGFLTMTSHFDKPSVVRRGQLVLDALLCDEPPPPAPGVQEMVTIDPDDYDSVRAFEEDQRSGSPCIECHAEMDPIGFALQPFDAIGLPRTLDSKGAPIDSVASLPDGTTFRGPWDVTEWVVNDDRLPRCMASKVFAWGLGREPTAVDTPHIDVMLERFEADGYTFRSLVHGLVETPAFTMKANPSSATALVGGEEVQ